MSTKEDRTHGRGVVVMFVVFVVSMVVLEVVEMVFSSKRWFEVTSHLKFPRPIRLNASGTTLPITTELIELH